MKILFINHKLLKSAWSSRFGRSVPQAVRLFTSLNLSEFEAINRGDKEVPKYFNFASDVLDKWSKIEKFHKRAAPSSHNCVQTRSDDPMVTFFTSGTTGSPKMAEHCQTSLTLGLALVGRQSSIPAKMSVSRRYWLDFKPSDVIWNMSDTGWVKGTMGGIFAPWLRGTSVFIHSMTQFDPKEVLKDSPEKNAAVVRGNFYITGDRGWMDEDGYFWFIGRSDDVIISSGLVHLNIC
ncbi:PREDICTED: acyl-coenzyme A synthetase ACSM4, mitochondrial-like [Thamnophis sirtalis]|uniref:medium-chain acyl-CoA ligase n=1 Tax=Thamnophis sirtalis TaxID=35019 RepID=A0A6I9Y7Q5_9SAUR|nr:PREDICTED: acyl-coenzyme A synthetase ACSM4, mitochondrial-like [Thamnophis sirtalis]